MNPNEKIDLIRVLTQQRLDELGLFFFSQSSNYDGELFPNSGDSTLQRLIDAFKYAESEDSSDRLLEAAVEHFNIPHKTNTAFAVDSAP